MRMDDLPTYDEAIAAEKSDDANPLEKFVADYTPVVSAEEEEFRNDLLNLINFVQAVDIVRP